MLIHTGIHVQQWSERSEHRRSHHGFVWEMHGDSFRDLGCCPGSCWRLCFGSSCELDMARHSTSYRIDFKEKLPVRRKGELPLRAL
ncbi:Uncharacterized protein OBRU01_03373 [Operophtera brumata]|uniref:Uncharacterized protein n=1 Tax=Operophtera brumata TaxID=104452 RepID=A0A0L7LIP8_OPEBR|nr:Uncharacterized protein OBRU01_03373 [Operophtera brumata]